MQIFKKNSAKYCGKYIPQDLMGSVPVRLHTIPPSLIFCKGEGAIFLYIEVLYGGNSPEREVSVCSGLRVVCALSALGHTVGGTDLRAEPDARLLARLRRADAVFLALHGGAGEDGRLQAFLEENGIFHYTGADAAASRLAMNKQNAKERVAAIGIPVARGEVLHAGQRPSIKAPFVLKPLCGGSSVGLRIVKGENEEYPVPCEDFLCESFLPGREFSVGVLGLRALPPVEIRPLGGVYDYAHKYIAGASEELCPAPLSDAERAHLQGVALAAFSALGLRDLARIDFKADADGIPVFLEANTLPGMTETSLLPLAASRVGISYGELCVKMAELAKRRKI
jgi:D-alanine-D-alanine ligase